MPFQAMKPATTTELTANVIAAVTVAETGTIARGNASRRTRDAFVDDRRHPERGRIAEETEEHDADQQPQRVELGDVAELEDAAEDEVEQGEERQRLDRPTRRSRAPLPAYLSLYSVAATTRRIRSGCFSRRPFGPAWTVVLTAA